MNEHNEQEKEEYGFVASKGVRREKELKKKQMLTDSLPTKHAKGKK
jgi:hypothetical protein